jgi:hypothetical protein
MLLSEVEKPPTRKVALASPEANYWSAAMDAEYNSLQGHDTWRLVPLPAERINIVSNRWVLDLKPREGGTHIARFKARLVARGFTQEHGVDYEETYSPVVRYKSLRLILGLVAEFDLRLEVMDVQTAYLHAPLKETVYMQQPEGYEQFATVGGERRPLVCLLQKAIYGLKQAGREWNLLLDGFVRSLGFTRCVSDTCVYVKKSRSGRPLIVSVYVDDIPSAYAREDAEEWGELKAAFFSRFKISFQAEATWFLSMRITRDQRTGALLLDQQAYVQEILEELRMDEGCKPAASPSADEPLSIIDAPATPETLAEMKGIPYRRAVGALMYLSNTSRPDITHAVSQVARFVSNPGMRHWRAVLKIMRYLGGTRDYGLLFESHRSAASAHSSPSSHAPGTGPAHDTSRLLTVIPLVGYADADWGGCPDTQRSTTGVIIQFGGSIVDWSSKRQATVALSSCEAEYMAVANALQSIMWTQNMLAEIGFQRAETQEALDSSVASIRSRLVTSRPQLFNDNRSALAMAQNDTHHQRSRHMSMRLAFVREQVAAKAVSLHWCSTQDQLADVLTKPLQASAYTRQRDLLVHSRAAFLVRGRQ